MGLWDLRVEQSKSPLVTDESIRQGELIEPNEALEGSMLDPTTLIGGGSAAVKGVDAATDAGKAYFKAAREMDPGKADLGRRASALATAGAIGHAMDPVSAAKSLAGGASNSLTMGLPGSGLGDSIMKVGSSIQNNLQGIAAMRKYRMDKVAGKDPDTAFLDSYIANKKLPFDVAANQLDFAANVGQNGAGKGLLDWVSSNKGVATMNFLQRAQSLAQ